MFGIGGGEMIFIIFIALMLFGTDKIPEVARTLGKGMAQLKNATNEIKSEIHKSAEENGLDRRTLTGGLSDEIDSLKGSYRNFAQSNPLTEELDSIQQDINGITSGAEVPDYTNVASGITDEINKAKQNLDDIVTGPIKRQS